MRKHWLAIFLAGSVILHLIVIFAVQFDSGTKKTPVIYAWPDIMSSYDLFSANPQTVPSEPFILPIDEIRRDYFSRFSDVLATAGSALSETPVSLPVFVREGSSGKIIPGNPKSAHFYLWEQPTLLSVQEQERASYRIFVSKQGKILFIYPEKLTTNASDALRVQEYIRSASFFLNKNFFWTNIEGVVK